jgi:hypothetical protein
LRTVRDADMMRTFSAAPQRFFFPQPNSAFPAAASLQSGLPAVLLLFFLSPCGGAGRFLYRGSLSGWA